MERNRSVILTLLILTFYVMVEVQWAQASVTSSSCISGKILNGSSGLFSSPNFPNKYPQYSNCTWNITVPSGYIIKINFLHFQVGYISSGGAQLTITNVASTGGTLSGNSLPDPVYSVGNSIQVIFTSLTNQYSGFNASYTAIAYESLCPNMMTLNDTSGTFTSPYYPRDYPPNQACSWQITASRGNYIVLVIKNMFLQLCGAACTCDYLEIQNGLSSDGDSSARRCGFLEDVIYHVFHDSLKVLFVSDISGVGSWDPGFKATYTQVNYTTIHDTCISGQLLNESSGSFSSPNFPNSYPQYSRCTWNITVPSGYIIKISFLHFRLGHISRGGAQLAIKKVAVSGGWLFGDALPDPVYSWGNSIQVIFTSLTNQYSIFNASYTAIAYESLCPNLMTLKETSGTITSPYFPRYYPHYRVCSWQITALRGNYIVLVIEYMYIPRCGAACTCGYLEIQNGLSSDGVSSARRCGYMYLDNVIYHVFHDSLKVLFFSGDGNGMSKPGFKATYTQVNYTTIPATCISGQLLTGSSGFFSSPNFPSKFPQYSRCTWNITVPSGYIIKISFLHFRLGHISSGGAQLTITNVPSGAQLPIPIPIPIPSDGVVTLDGDSLPYPVYSVRNSIQVIFISLTNQYSGFNASYTAITYESLCPNLISLNDTSGVITSPYYPRLYPANQTCSWQITASKGKRIKLVIKDMLIISRRCGQTCTCDYLEIQNGSFSSDAVPAERMCGYLLSSVTLYSFQETLKVLFVSSQRVSRHYSQGFRATYTQLNNTASSECSSYRFLDESNRARAYSGITKLCDTTLSGWYRFSGAAGSQMAESCVDRGHCGTDAPGWLNGSHPAVADGAVQRRACFNHLNNCCYYSTYISVRNCGIFYVYKLDRPPHCSLRYCGNGLPLAPECCNYRLLNESNRARTYGRGYLSDNRLSGWFRFSGGAGNQMAESCVGYYHCGTILPGWLNGSHPAVDAGAVQRRVRFSCYGSFSYYYSIFIGVRNCGGFYVYKLKPAVTRAYLRYCGNGFVPPTPVTPACTSGEYRNGSSGFFSSPNFPNIYPQNSRCTWNITVPSGYIIKINFLHFQLGWQRDGAQLTIKNVASGAVTLHGWYPPDPVYSVGNSIQVIFQSYINQFSGFNASYTAITYESHLPTFSLLSFAETEAVVQLVNRKTLSNGNPVRYFQIIVIPLKEGTGSGNHPEIIKRKYEDQEEGEPYITAEFSKDESRTTFTVGDGKYYWRSGVTEAVTKYLNGKLKSNSQYAVFQRSFDEDGAYENEGIVQFTTKAKGFPTAIVVSVVVVLLVLLILAGAFMVWRRIQRHEIKTSSMHLQHCSTQGWTEMSANINTYIDRTELGSARQNVWGDGCGGRGEGGGGGEPKHSET